MTQALRKLFNGRYQKMLLGVQGSSVGVQGHLGMYDRWKFIMPEFRDFMMKKILWEVTAKDADLSEKGPSLVKQEYGDYAWGIYPSLKETSIFEYKT